MENLKVTVLVEDQFGIIFREHVEIPREDLIPPGSLSSGMETVAGALLKWAAAGKD